MRAFFLFFVVASSFLQLPFLPLAAKIGSASALEDLSEKQATASLERLIEVTQQNLHTQKQLLQHIKQYCAAKEFFFQNDQDQDNINLLVSVADQAWTQIQQQQLQTIFPSDFIEELMLFAQLARTQQIATP